MYQFAESLAVEEDPNYHCYHDSNQNNSSMNNNIKINNYFGKTKLLCHLLLYWFIVAIYVWLLFFYSCITIDIIVANWNTLYHCFLFVCVLTKYTLKRIGQRIDIKRIRLKRYHINMNQSIFSYEWITEIFMSLIYWMVYRWKFVSVLQNLSLSDFIITMTTHMISEILQTSLKISYFYHSVIQNKICKDHVLTSYKNNDGDLISLSTRLGKINITCIKLKPMIVWIAEKMYDDSNYDEWVCRNAVDIVIRFNSSIISSIMDDCIYFNLRKRCIYSIFLVTIISNINLVYLWFISN